MVPAPLGTALESIQKKLKLTDKEVGTIVQKQPRALQLRQEKVLNNIEILQENLGWKSSTLKQQILKQPSILGANNKTMHDKVLWLIITRETPWQHISF